MLHGPPTRGDVPEILGDPKVLPKTSNPCSYTCPGHSFAVPNLSFALILVIEMREETFPARKRRHNSPLQSKENIGENPSFTHNHCVSTCRTFPAPNRGDTATAKHRNCLPMQPWLHVHNLWPCSSCPTLPQNSGSPLENAITMCVVDAALITCVRCWWIFVSLSTLHDLNRLFNVSGGCVTNFCTIPRPANKFRPHLFCHASCRGVWLRFPLRHCLGFRPVVQPVLCQAVDCHAHAHAPVCSRMIFSSLKFLMKSTQGFRRASGLPPTPTTGQPFMACHNVISFHHLQLHRTLHGLSRSMLGQLQIILHPTVARSRHRGGTVRCHCCCVCANTD